MGWLRFYPCECETFRASIQYEFIRSWDKHHEQDRVIDNAACLFSLKHRERESALSIPLVNDPINTI